MRFGVDKGNLSSTDATVEAGKHQLYTK